MFDIGAAVAAGICCLFALLLMGAGIAEEKGAALFLGLICVAGAVVPWLKTRRRWSRPAC